jgi:hypothetical protein
VTALCHTSKDHHRGKLLKVKLIINLQVVASQQATTPVDDGTGNTSGPTTPQPSVVDGQVGVPTPPQQQQQQQQAQFQQVCAQNNLSLSSNQIQHLVTGECED